MQIVLVGLAITFSAATNVANPAPPTGLPPRFITVAKIDKEVIELIEVEAVKGIQGQTAVSTRKAKIEALRGFNRKGLELDRDTWLKRLKPGEVVVVSTDHRKVAPAYLAVLREDAVVLWGVRVQADTPAEPK